ncbi:facilitated trehalose transporter Tret1-like [Sitodiplosis mosellana]|uniref:facilitated trehalose transporter Tret1-like n=1 Tax=Sitodiplosis mosellana TaxID=263140 RepID=UPI002444E7A8|nr:facilitated trehalose transporter Tret1-like [Sitodiplosis mosellana]
MVQSSDKMKSIEMCIEKVSRFRRILPQFIATTVKNLLLTDLGLITTFPSILIPALTGISNEHNRNEFITITPSEASWLGSICYLLQPFGSLLSILITDSLGRKRSMIIVNLPLAIGWFMVYQGDVFWKIISGYALLGLGVGMMEAPLITYLGEICEPSTRGVLIAYSGISVTLGIFMVFGLNTLMAWRSVALVCLAMPVITAVAVCFIPETPQWLLSKNRKSEAEKSLCWLRGWVSSDVIANEFYELQKHSERSKSCDLCIKENLKCVHPLPTMREKLSEMKRKRTLKPFSIIISLFVIVQFTGIASMAPFMVRIFKAYESPIPPDQAAAIMSFLNNLATVIFIISVRFSGKRRFFLTMLTGIFLCSAILACYGFIYLPTGYISFDQNIESLQPDNGNIHYIPLVCLILWSCFSYCGFLTMPWMLLSEIFPFRSRGIASGFAAAFCYILGFISRKTYYNLEFTLSLPGSTLFYCAVSGLGFIVMYLILPETENISLEDIELHYSDNSKKITDHKIVKSSQKMVAKDVENSFKKTEMECTKL